MEKNQLRGITRQMAAMDKILLMLDYDGTLVPIAEKPELAVPGPGILHCLQLLARRKDIVTVVISGRELADLKGMLPVAGLGFSGCHGAVIENPGGGRHQLVDSTRVSPIIGSLAEKAREIIGGNRGFLVENKKTALAVHYRLADRGLANLVISRFTEAVQPLLPEYELELIHGKKVLEVRPVQANKGAVVRYMINRFPAHFPLYLGDDTTDEDAFWAIRATGTGVLVADKPRKSAAVQRFESPEDVLGFLQIIATR